MDLILSIIKQIDEGETDSEFETLLKAMVPDMLFIDKTINVTQTSPLNLKDWIILVHSPRTTKYLKHLYRLLYRAYL